MVSSRSLITFTSMRESKRTMTERFDKVCGQIGVSVKNLAEGLTTALFAESEYAVELVGELTIKPSQRYVVSVSPSTLTSNSMRRETIPRLMIKSFNAN